MISTAVSHAKFRMFVRHIRPLLGDFPLDVETVAVGLLERLWHVTASSAIRGDIGRLSNDLIAEMVGWHGDSEKLIESYRLAGWIDQSKEHRLLVHDWADHAPNHVKGNASKLGGIIATPKRGPAPEAPPQGPSPKGDAHKDRPTKPNQSKPNQSNSNTGADKSACVSRKPPTVGEIRLYCETMNLTNVDPDEFHDHYESAGWKLKGGQPMRDWQAAARNWHRRDFNNKSKNQDRTKGAVYDGKPIATDF